MHYKILQRGKSVLSFFPSVTVSDPLWFRHSAFCSVHLSLLLCLAGETAAINKTPRWSAHPAVKYWSWSSLHHFGVRANMISHHPSPQFFFSFCAMSAGKKNPFCIDVVWKIQKHMRALDDTDSTNINQKKSDILWWHVLVIRHCSVKYWKQRYVGVDFDHCWPCLSCAALRPCQATSKHSNMCFSPEFSPELPSALFCSSTTMMTL